MLRILTIARNTFVESLRQPVVLVFVLLCGFFQILNTWNSNFSMGQELSGEIKGDDKLLLDIGLATVFVCGTLLAGFIATAALTREIDNKTILTVISKPVGRPTLILGKFVGVSAALLLAGATMLIFLLLGIRHGVMSTAADELDGPVLVFAAVAFFASVGIAAWCNFFYGWSFPQTACVLLLPLILAGYVTALSLSKEWKWQPLHTDFKPEVTLACACLLMALLVLSAVAVAASTRLGQVMTIVACLGTFLAALLSNAVVGKHAFRNDALGVVDRVEFPDSEHATFRVPGDSVKIHILRPTAQTLRVGMPLYYGPSPNGHPLLTEAFTPFSGQLDDPNQTLGPSAAPALVITAVHAQDITVRHIGGRPLRMDRAPEHDDYLFTTATRTNPLALAVWGAVPNLQFFWLIDAVSQSQPIPGTYVALTALYTACQVVVFLSLAVVLFQRRDVG